MLINEIRIIITTEILTYQLPFLEKIMRINRRKFFSWMSLGVTISSIFGLDQNNSLSSKNETKIQSTTETTCFGNKNYSGLVSQEKSFSNQSGKCTYTGDFTNATSVNLQEELDRRVVTPEMFYTQSSANSPDELRGNSVDATAAIQAAIDALANQNIPLQGGTVKLQSGIYRVSSISLKDFVYLEGSGQNATILKALDGVDSKVVYINSDVAGVGIQNLAVDGNKQNNTNTFGIYFEDSASGAGNFNLAGSQKATDTSDESYKHVQLHNIAVHESAQDGIYVGFKNFQVYITNFSVNFNRRHGLNVVGTDSIFGHFYADHNGSAGVKVSSGAHKFYQGKCIWNGFNDNTWAGFYCKAGGVGTISNIQVFGVEAQDNYCNGFYINGNDLTFLVNANENGYFDRFKEDVSSDIHANFVIENVKRLYLVGKSFTRRDADWNSNNDDTAEYPYRLLGTNEFLHFSISTDGKTSQQAPLQKNVISNTGTGEIGSFSNNNSDSFLDFNGKSPDGYGDVITRHGRGTNTTGIVADRWYLPGEPNVNHQITNDGDAIFGQQGYNLKSSNGNWDNGHLVLGSYHIWVDANGKLRIKNGSPSSDTDGTIIGNQS